MQWVQLNLQPFDTWSHTENMTSPIIFSHKEWSLAPFCQILESPQNPNLRVKAEWSEQQTWLRVISWSQSASHANMPKLQRKICQIISKLIKNNFESKIVLIYNLISHNKNLIEKIDFHNLFNAFSLNKVQKWTPSSMRVKALLKGLFTPKSKTHIFSSYL